MTTYFISFGEVIDNVCSAYKVLVYHIRVTSHYYAGTSDSRFFYFLKPASNKSLQIMSALYIICCVAPDQIMDVAAVNGTLTGPLCGKHIPPPVLSISNRVNIMLRTDSSVSFEGFDITFVASSQSN